MTMVNKLTQQAPHRPRVPIAKVVLNLWLVAALIGLTLAVYMVKPQLLSAGNVTSVLRSFSIMVVMVLGVTWVFAAGKIDVSFMQVAALANMLCAYCLDQGLGWGPAIAASLGSGVVVGLLNGWLVAVMGLPALIVTISMSGVCASIAAALGRGTVIRIDGDGPLSGLLEPTGAWAFPPIVIPVLLIAGLAWYVQERLTLGRYIYAMGTNEAAVSSVGVPVRRIAVYLFVLSSTCAALSGVMLADSLSSGQPLIGGPFLINGLTVVLLGAMMVRIGRPNILGTLTATLFIGILFSSAALLGLPDYQRQFIQGALLLAGLIVAELAARQHRSTTAKAAGGPA